MTSRVQRVAPWQATKLFTLLYFFVGLIVMVPLLLVALMVPQPDSDDAITVGFALIFPVMYALIGLIFVPIGCLLYNFCARLVGGIEVVIDERTG
jgi:hypothetical protein